MHGETGAVVVHPYEAATTDQRLSIVSTALEWSAVAQAMVIIHGKERAPRVLVEHGCPVRFDDAGEVVVFHDDKWWRLTPEQAKRETHG